MSTDLKECPFCNSSNVVVYGNDWFVACENCDAQGPKALNPADSAISFWNTRNSAGANTAASAEHSIERAEGPHSLIEKLAARADRADMWTGETPVIWLQEAEDIVRQHEAQQSGSLTEDEKREAFEIIRRNTALGSTMLAEETLFTLLEHFDLRRRG
ncbi:Lar family restriction alleviation protein [Fimbriiglobus ruber]|nr:Lar family restriction alleviation protein [Fimbriiglobus ruber]